MPELPPELDLPRAKSAIDETILRGVKTHPGGQKVWPPPYTTLDNLHRAIVHIQEYLAGNKYDKEGFNHLHNALTRLAFETESEGIRADSLCLRFARQTLK